MLYVGHDNTDNTVMGEGGAKTEWRDTKENKMMMMRPQEWHKGKRWKVYEELRWQWKDHWESKKDSWNVSFYERLTN